jgi:hypothetical protein
MSTTGDEMTVRPDAGEPAFTLVDLPCGCQDVHYEDGTVDREHDHVECDGTPLAEAGR